MHYMKNIGFGVPSYHYTIEEERENEQNKDAISLRRERAQAVYVSVSVRMSDGCLNLLQQTFPFFSST